MGRIRARLIGWTYDDTRQEIHTPAGAVIPLRDIAQRLYDDIRCRYDFGGAWTGWKMRGDRLIPPHGGRFGPALKPDTAAAFARWVAEATCGNAPQPRPRLRIIQGGKAT